MLAILYSVSLLVQVFTLLLAFSHCPSCIEEGDCVIVMHVAKENAVCTSKVVTCVSCVVQKV